MPVLPQPDERDRSIAPIENDDGSTMQPDDDLDITEGTPIDENPDGSATVKLEDDTEPDFDDSDFQQNLAELFEEQALSSVATELIELVEIDKKSREKRDKQYEEGLRRTGLGDDAPGGASFDGASRVVHPMLAEGCVDFASRAIKELFPPGGPVKSTIIGKNSDDKIERADRKVRYLNWQLTKKIKEYRAELEQLLTQLPMGGSQYQKFYYDENIERTRVEFVPIDDVYIPYAATDFDSAQRTTHVQHITQAEYENRVASGLYRDLGIDSIQSGYPDQSAASKANDKIEGKEQDAYNEDGLRDIYEISTYYAFDEDGKSKGKYAPYIIIIDQYSEKTLGVYRNWDEKDDKLEKLDWMVEWKFIPWRGAYAIGYPHLIGGISGAATGSLRALLDAAHINNSQTLVKIKGGKTSGQNLEVEPTQIAEIEGPAGIDDIRKLMMAMPYNPPSEVLFNLLNWLTTAGKGVVSTTEDALQNVGDRTPVGTTMALIEQGSAKYSAIHARLHASQAKALEIICRLNRDYLEDSEVVEELDELVVSRADFEKNGDICPVSDPNIFSEAQRYAQLQGVIQLQTTMPELKWNKNEVARRMLRRMHLDDIDSILPEEKKPQNMNPVAENVASLAGTPLLALPQQNHLAHLWIHMKFATNPTFMNPIVGQKMLPQLIEHAKQHIGFYYADLMSKSSNYDQVAESMPTKQLEDSMAHVSDEAIGKVTSSLQPIMQMLQAAAQAAQQMAPKPPMDPAIEATYNAAMAEIARKTKLDAAEMDLKKQQHLQLQPKENDLDRQNDLLKNYQNNEQHQTTELLKNQGDNQTNQFVAALRENNAQLMQQFQAQLDVLNQNTAQSHAMDMQDLQQQHATATQVIDQGHAQLMAQQQQAAQAQMQQQQAAQAQQQAQAAPPQQPPSNQGE